MDSLQLELVIANAKIDSLEMAIQICNMASEQQGASWSDTAIFLGLFALMGIFYYSLFKYL